MDTGYLRDTVRASDESPNPVQDQNPTTHPWHDLMQAVASIFKRH